MSKKDKNEEEIKQSVTTPSEEAPATEPAPKEPVQAEKSAEEKLAELNDKYIRLYADFENFRKRASKERMELFKFAGEEVYAKLIPVLDDFERAMKAASTATDIETIKQGELLIYNKFKNMLTQSGLQEMNAAGQPFDSELHEAITNVPAPSEDMKGKVIEEIEKGYYLNGKVIRHAKVLVGN